MKEVKKKRAKRHAKKQSFIAKIDKKTVAKLPKFLRLPVRLIIILIFSVITGLGLLWLSAQIPSSAIHNKTSESADYYLSNPRMKPVLMEGYNNTMRDYYADSIWLSIAYAYDGSLKSVIESKYAFVEKVSQGENFRAQLDGKLDANKEYFRYWHGPIVLIRPLLLVFNVQQIYWLCTAAIILLFAAIIFLLCKHREYIAAIITGITFIIGGFFLGGISLEYTQVFLVTGIISLIAMRKVWQNQSKQLPYLFFFSGILINYLDFMTAETLTLTFPLLLVLWLRRKHKMSELKFEKILLYMFLWVLGYGLMWGSKWLITRVALGGEVWQSIGGQMGLRSYSQTIGLSLPQMFFIALRLNLHCLTIFCFSPWISVAFVIAFIALLIYAFRNRPLVSDWYWVASVIIVSLVPILRIIIMTEHELLHYFFTYRAFSVIFMGILLIWAKVFEKRKE